MNNNSTKLDGYYRFPTLFDQRVVFVCEDDLWEVALTGGKSRRLTVNQSFVICPRFSPNGQWIAYTAAEEGESEVYLIPTHGGSIQRLTHLGGDKRVLSWQDDETLIFYSTHEAPAGQPGGIYQQKLNGGLPTPVNLGAVSSYHVQGNKVLLGRYTMDSARWKRYRGGASGEIWIDRSGRGRFEQLIELNGGLANPLFLKKRVYFVSDHEGRGNLYSCDFHGKDLRCHSAHDDFYVRFPSTDGEKIVYQCGADLYVYDPNTESVSRVEIEHQSVRSQQDRKFVAAEDYLDDYDLSPDGALLAVATRGKGFYMGCWEGFAAHVGQQQGVHYRFPRFLANGKSIVMSSDERGEERLEVYAVSQTRKKKKIIQQSLGRIADIKPSPKGEKLAVTNHRNELFVVDLKKSEVKLIEQSSYGPMNGFNWSPDGAWIVYSIPVNQRQSIIKVYSVSRRSKRAITQPLLFDFNPCFDPYGRYLYFLSARVFNPVYDQLHFDAGFPRGIKPYLITLTNDLLSPFVLSPEPIESIDEQEEVPEKVRVKIDFEGIENRAVAFPLRESIYKQLLVTSERVYFTEIDVEGALFKEWGYQDENQAVLRYLDLKKRKVYTAAQGVSDIKLSLDGTALLYKQGREIRVVAADVDVDTLEKEETSPANRRSGWVDLSRIKVSIQPQSEWRQMLDEAWRLQRDYFWNEEMSGVKWDHVLEMYRPLVERVASRDEFSDLIGEMQGELGTSHTYELGGDYRPVPRYPIGLLGAEYHYVAKYDAYRVQRIIQGDSWDPTCQSPLLAPGVNISEGMLLLAINGTPLGKNVTPGQLLVNLAGEEVELRVADRLGQSPRTVTVRALYDDARLRYRNWVERNRQYVAEKSKGQVGYIHIPDMSAFGYAEFHRYFLAELDKAGLVIDVRFNGGGHVSQLILEKLSRQRLGYDVTRWMGKVIYPAESPSGPMVALTNELAGSDGDIFCHAFKLLKLGPLIGKRTWGGVVGIWPRNSLVDGTVTTQPELSFWFCDVGLKVENYGTEPDIEVDYLPQDYKKGRDPQLDRAIREVDRLIKSNKG